MTLTVLQAHMHFMLPAIVMPKSRQQAQAHTRSYLLARAPTETSSLLHQWLAPERCSKQ